VAEQAEQDFTSRSVAFGSVRVTPEQGKLVVVWVKGVCSGGSGVFERGEGSELDMSSQLTEHFLKSTRTLE